MHMGLFRCRTAPAQRASKTNNLDDVKSCAQPFTSRLFACLQSPLSSNQLTPHERVTPEKLCEAEEGPSKLSKYTLRGDTPLSRRLTRNNAQWRATVQSLRDSHNSQLKEQQEKLVRKFEADREASLLESARLHEKEVTALQSQLDQLGCDTKVLPLISSCCTHFLLQPCGIC